MPSYRGIDTIQVLALILIGGRTLQSFQNRMIVPTLSTNSWLLKTSRNNIQVKFEGIFSAKFINLWSSFKLSLLYLEDVHALTNDWVFQLQTLSYFLWNKTSHILGLPCIIVNERNVYCWIVTKYHWRRRRRRRS